MKSLIIFAFLYSIFYILNPFSALAFAPPPCPPNTPDGTVCLENPLASESTDAKVIIGTIIKGVLGILGSITLLMLIWGGFLWLTSAGKEEQIKKGSATMIWALIGVAVIFSAYILINTLTDLLSGK
ncbi:MAG: hypothetical protein AAB467_03505 [Patescibacteria group bacterium]